MLQVGAMLEMGVAETVMKLQNLAKIWSLHLSSLCLSPIYGPTLPFGSSTTSVGAVNQLQLHDITTHMMLIIAMLNQRGGGTNGSAFSSGDSLFTAHFLPPYLSETLGYRYPESYMDLSRGSIDGSAGAQAHLEDGEKKFDPERKTDRTERLDKNLDKPKESFFFSSSKDKNSQSDKGDKSDVRYAAGSQRGAIPPLGSSLLGQDGLLSRELTHFFYMRFPTQLLFSQPPFHLYNALNAGTNNNPDRKSSDGTNSKGQRQQQK
jgi:hypothetical protein